MRIKLTGWDVGLSVVETCKFLVANTSLSLLQAKRTCEALLEGKDQVVEIKSDQLGFELVRSLEDLHVSARVEVSSS